MLFLAYLFYVKDDIDKRMAILALSVDCVIEAISFILLIAYYIQYGKL